MASPTPAARLPVQGLVVITIATLISVMNGSMGTVVLPEIRTEFNVGPDTLSWTVTAYLIPFAAGAVVFGRLADINGTRQLFLFGLALFAAGSLAVAAAPSYAVLVGMRVLQGAGGAAGPALGMMTVIRTTDSERRGTAVGVLILAVGLGFGLGPLVGGALADGIGWQGPFLFTGIASALVFPAALRWLPDVPGDSKQRIDVPGTLILLAAVTGTVIALNRLARDPGDALGLGAAAIAVPGMIILAAWMASVSNPLIPGRLMRSERFLPMALVGFAAQGAHLATIVLIPLLLAEFHQLSVIEIGFRLLPGAAALGVFGVFGGRLTRTVGERVLLIVGTWVMLSGALIFHITGVDFGTWNVGLVYLLIAAGYGMVNTACLKAATDRLPESLAGIGTGVFNLHFFLGGAVAVAATGAILRRRMDAEAAWNPAFDGVAVAYSDAMLVVVGFALVAFLITVVLRPQNRTAVEQQPVDPASEWIPMTDIEQPVLGPPAWAVKPRAKPITNDGESGGAVAHGPAPKPSPQRSRR